MKIKKLVLSLLYILCFVFTSFTLASCGKQPTETPTLQTPTLQTPKKSDFVGNVFQIISKDLNEDPVATGTGFVFDSQGWFITNSHVMEDAYNATAIFNIENPIEGESFTYLEIEKGCYNHSDKDIFIGKITNYSSISKHYKKFSFTTEFKLGETTYSVGYPSSSIDLKINKGEVIEEWSNLYDKLYSGNTYVCSNSYIAPGSSGGILINAKKEILGITTLGFTNDYGKFVKGAAISYFNFMNQLNGVSSSTFVDIDGLLHPNEKVFIAIFKNIKNEKGAETFENYKGKGYICKWSEEGVNDDGESYIFSRTLTIFSNKWIEYDEEYVWDDGDKKNCNLYGTFSDKNWLADFSFHFFYSWGEGGRYGINSDNINYSTNITLTLKNYSWSGISTVKKSAEHVNYAKENFNYTYERLLKLLERLK